jgi:hypothetical protein
MDNIQGLPKEILIASLKSQLEIEIAKKRAIVVYPGNNIEYGICIATINEIERQLNILTKNL